MDVPLSSYFPPGTFLATSPRYLFPEGGGVGSFVPTSIILSTGYFVMDSDFLTLEVCLPSV